MGVDKWDFPTAFSLWDDSERAAIERVIKSGQFTMAGEVAALEREFADFHGLRHGIMVNSGSSANLIAVASLFHKKHQPLRRHDDSWRGLNAIVPALAWSTTYAPLVQHGLNLILADCDATWNAPIPSRAAMLPRVAVICSILGNPCYGEEWEKLAIDDSIYLIEDNCESFGAIDAQGQLCGTRGILSTFSFFYSHQISAIEGGMILTDNDELAGLCRMLRSHGWTRDIKKPERFEDEYDFQVMGYNVRPLEMHAAIAREQLKKTAQFQAARWANYVAFRNMTMRLPITLPALRGAPNPFGLHFTVNGGQECRRRLVGALRAAGIDCRLPTGGSLGRHCYGFPWANQPTPNADLIHDTGLFCGNAPYSIEEKIHRLAEVIRETLGASN
jgi:CDP-6-deoxy-D-xylo-4-hexulose-3-dehydrase